MKTIRPVFLFGLLWLSLLSACVEKTPIQIGYVSELSGKNAGIGVLGRNGAQLAVDGINAAGGVKGRSLELLARDSQGQEDALKSADQELINAGVVALTGHMASWESIAALPLIETQKVSLFSPTTSTPLLSGKQDYFFRLIPVNTAQVEPLADYAFEQLHLHRAAALYDRDNQAFAQTCAEGFLVRFTALGAEQVAVMPFSSSAAPDYQQIVADLRQSNPDVLLIVASAMNTALIAQQVRLSNWSVQMVSTNWAYTDEFLQNAGRAAEGTLFPSHFNPGCQTPAYLDFKQKYESAYGQPPGFAAVLSYETIKVLADVLAQGGDRPADLAQALASSRQVNGLCDKIALDAFGDAQRSLYLFRVMDGRYQLVQTIEPLQP